MVVLGICSCTSEYNIFDNDNSKLLNFTVSVPEWKNNDSSSACKTRATPISGTSLDKSNSFNIIADVYDGKSSYSNIINNETVSFTNNMWKTVTPHYWPGTTNSTVNFYAYYPTSIKNGTITNTAGTTPKLTYTIPDDATDQEDIMISTSTGISGTTYSSNSISFKHILAAIKFAVGTNGLPSGTIKSISISGINNSGTYTFGGNWTLGSTTSSFTSSPLTVITGQSGVGITSDSYTFLMIPQTFTNATITLTYNTGTAYKQTISGTWAAGNTYIYNLSKTVNIGDYYYSDGTWGNIAEHSNSIAKPIAVIFSNVTSTTDKGHDWTHGYGMALTNASLSAKWGTYGQDTPLENLNVGISGWEYALNLKDGYTNTQTIKNTYDLSSTSYPAFYYAINYAMEYPMISSGWFLPSIGQWSDICINIGNVSQTPDNVHYNGLIWNSASLNCINNINSKLISIENLGYNISKFSTEDKYWSSNEADDSNGTDAFYIYFSDNLYLDQNINDGLRKNGSWIIRPVIAF